MVSIDLSKAFDLLKYSEMMTALRDTGMPESLCRVLLHIHAHTQTCHRAWGTVTPHRHAARAATRLQCGSNDIRMLDHSFVQGLGFQNEINGFGGSKHLDPEPYVNFR